MIFQLSVDWSLDNSNQSLRNAWKRVMEHNARQLSVIWQNSLQIWRINYSRCVLNCKVTTHTFLCNKTLWGYQPRQVVERRTHKRFQNQLCSRHQRTKIISPMTGTQTVLETLGFSPFNHVTRKVTRESFIAFSRRESFGSCNRRYLCLNTKSTSKRRRAVTRYGSQALTFH